LLEEFPDILAHDDGEDSDSNPDENERLLSESYQSSSVVNDRPMEQGSE